MTDQAPQYQPLCPHPDNPPSSVRAVAARARRGATPGELLLQWRVEGTLAALAIPTGPGGERRDGLWRHTCFEAFLRERGQRAYCEFNFSPGGDWAAYHFDDLRQGMSDLPVSRPPRLTLARRADVLQLEATVCLEVRPEGARACSGACFLALTAVIESRDGTLGFWALRHPPGKPDFHHPDGFVIGL